MSATFSPRGGLFLDRDGVVNVDEGYVHRPDQIAFVPGIFELGRAAMRLNLPIMIITNQAGIARNLYTPAQFHEPDGLDAWDGSPAKAWRSPMSSTARGFRPA